MARNLPSYDHMVEDDYIDMDVSSATFLSYSKSSPPHSRDFEFQMSFKPPERDTTPSPADELFYKGKLLPLHLPPRLQMVRKLLQIESCNISPANSHQANGELDPEEYMDEFSSELIQSQRKKSWSKKLKLIGQSSISLKLKASRAYIKSLFAKSRCIHHESNAVTGAKDCSKGYMKAGKQRIERERPLEEEYIQRKSFSGAINCRNLTTKYSPAVSSWSSSSSSSSSFSSLNSKNGQMLNRSGNVDSEMESSIQGAIAYCKKSQVSARKSVSDVEFCSLSASRIPAACQN